jgi:uracil-DNA glycosylase family 4
MFTGDGSGEFLFRALFRAGFANQPDVAHQDDGLVLSDVFITAVCRCVPPANKPTKEEIVNCLPYLHSEIELLVNLQGIVALGHIAFDNTLRLFRQIGCDIPSLVFSHGGIYQLGEDLPWLVASYHPSRQNTQTGRLTEEMFAEIWEKVKLIIQ